LRRYACAEMGWGIQWHGFCWKRQTVFM